MADKKSKSMCHELSRTKEPDHPGHPAQNIPRQKSNKTPSKSKAKSPVKSNYASLECLDRGDESDEADMQAVFDDIMLKLGFLSTMSLSGSLVRKDSLVPISVFKW